MKQMIPSSNEMLQKRERNRLPKTGVDPPRKEEGHPAEELIE